MLNLAHYFPSKVHLMTQCNLGTVDSCLTDPIDERLLDQSNVMGHLFKINVYGINQLIAGCSSGGKFQFSHFG